MEIGKGNICRVYRDDDDDDHGDDDEDATTRN